MDVDVVEVCVRVFWRQMLLSTLLFWQKRAGRIPNLHTMCLREQFEGNSLFWRNLRFHNFLWSSSEEVLDFWLKFFSCVDKYAFFVSSGRVGVLFKSKRNQLFQYCFSNFQPKCLNIREKTFFTAVKTAFSVSRERFWSIFFKASTFFDFYSSRWIVFWFLVVKKVSGLTNHHSMRPS